ncbi:MAG TPA: tRNA pseudouridine(55) synthase TruB [Cellvibrionaceae bacterium]
MGRSKHFGRVVNGLIILNKTQGITSNRALQQAKHLFFANKAGHTGSLDPLATGVLPLCFGEATKFSSHLLDADKRYQTSIQLGVRTDTCDCEGVEISRQDASHITQSAVEKALDAFRGPILQVPPMVSALKHQGRPLYALAREGIEIERPPRPVTIFSLTMLSFTPGPIPELVLDIHCSKGTYIRSIAEDLGHALSVGGHVVKLHRTQAGPFTIEHAVNLCDLIAERGEQGPEVLDHHLLALDAAIETLPQLTLEENSAHYFLQGQGVMDLRVYRLGQQGDRVRVFRSDGRFLGLGEIGDDGLINPKRLVQTV